MSLTRDQRQVAKAMAFAVLFCLIYISAAYYWLPISFPSALDLLGRLQFAVQCDLFALLMLLLGIVVVAQQRFFSPTAITGMTPETDTAVVINRRYIQNTLEQFVLLFITHLTLATLLTASSIRLIPILVSLFILGRILFWIGYHHSPLSRAFGFATTFYPTLFFLILCCVKLIG